MSFPINTSNTNPTATTTATTTTTTTNSNNINSPDNIDITNNIVGIQPSNIRTKTIITMTNYPEEIALFLFTSDSHKFEPGILVDFLSAKYFFPPPNPNSNFLDKMKRFSYHF